jgi:hypothetical protein
MDYGRKYANNKGGESSGRPWENSTVLDTVRQWMEADPAILDWLLDHWLPEAIGALGDECTRDEDNRRRRAPEAYVGERGRGTARLLADETLERDEMAACMPDPAASWRAYAAANGISQQRQQRGAELPPYARLMYALGWPLREIGSGSGEDGGQGGYRIAYEMIPIELQRMRAILQLARAVASLEAGLRALDRREDMDQAGMLDSFLEQRQERMDALVAALQRRLAEGAEMLADAGMEDEAREETARLMRRLEDTMLREQRDSAADALHDRRLSYRTLYEQEEREDMVLKERFDRLFMMLMAMRSEGDGLGEADWARAALRSPPVGPPEEMQALMRREMDDEEPAEEDGDLADGMGRRASMDMDMEMDEGMGMRAEEDSAPPRQLYVLVEQRILEKEAQAQRQSAVSSAATRVGVLPGLLGFGLGFGLGGALNPFFGRPYWGWNRRLWGRRFGRGRRWRRGPGFRRRRRRIGTAYAAPAPYCHGCAALLGVSGGPAAQRCAGCRAAFYCGAACQETHFKAWHGDECPRLFA